MPTYYRMLLLHKSTSNSFVFSQKSIVTSQMKYFIAMCFDNTQKIVNNVETMSALGPIADAL